MRNKNDSMDENGLGCVNLTDEHLISLKEVFAEPPFNIQESSIISAAYISISLVGLLGNGLIVLLVITMRKMRGSTNIFIANMSFANFLFSAILVPFLWLPYLKGSWDYGSFWCKQVSVIAGLNVFCSASTIIALAADRYYSVTALDSTTGQKKRLTAGFIVILIWLASIIFAIPFWLYYDVSSVTLEEFCRPDIVVSTTCDFLIPTTSGYVVSGLQVLFLLPIPLLSLAIFNCRLSLFLSKRNANVSNVLRRETCAKRTRVPILLSAMTASYGLLWMPFVLFVAIGDISVEIFIQHDDSGHAFRRIHVALHILSSFSVCINPILYGFLNSSFKAAFSELWACVRHRSIINRSSTNVSGYLSVPLRLELPAYGKPAYRGISAETMFC